MSQVANAPRRYFIEFNAAMLLYIGAVVGRKLVLPQIADPALRDLILASPIIPILLVALTVLRFYRRMDEYHRLQLLETLAASAAITTVVTASWGFLEDIGFPHLRSFHAFIIMMVSWGVISLWRGWRERAADGGGWRAIRASLIVLFYVAIGTAAYAVIAEWAGWPSRWPNLLLVATTLFIVQMGFLIFSRKSTC